MKRYIPYEVDFDCKVIGDKETIRVQGVMLEHPEGPYVNFADVKRLIAERDAAVARYEHIRRLNVQQFKILWDRNLAGERFDDMVDAAIGAARGAK